MHMQAVSVGQLASFLPPLESMLASSASSSSMALPASASSVAQPRQLVVRISIASSVTAIDQDPYEVLFSQESLVSQDAYHEQMSPACAMVEDAILERPAGFLEALAEAAVVLATANSERPSLTASKQMTALPTGADPAKLVGQPIGTGRVMKRPATATVPAPVSVGGGLDGGGPPADGGLGGGEPPAGGSAVDGGLDDNEPLAKVRHHWTKRTEDEWSTNKNLTNSTCQPLSINFASPDVVHHSCNHVVCFQVNE